MEGHGKPRNLDNFAVTSHGILRTGPRPVSNYTDFAWGCYMAGEQTAVVHRNCSSSTC